MLDLSSDLTMETTVLGVQKVDFTSDSGNRLLFLKIHVAQQLKNGVGYNSVPHRFEDVTQFDRIAALVGRKARVTGFLSGRDGNSSMTLTKIEPVQVSK